MHDLHAFLSQRGLCVMQKYKSLVSEGRFQQTLLEMYRWGKQHGWDPAALRPAAGAASHQTP